MTRRSLRKPCENIDLLKQNANGKRKAIKSLFIISCKNQNANIQNKTPRLFFTEASYLWFSIFSFLVMFSFFSPLNRNF